MLHIVLMILKIIGIILAVLLGLILVLLLILLFVPLRYEIDGKGTNLKDLKGKVSATWFLHLIRFDGIYKNRKFKWKLRIAFIKRSNGAKVKEEPKEEPKAEEVKGPEEPTEEEVKALLDSFDEEPEIVLEPVEEDTVKEADDNVIVMDSVDSTESEKEIEKEAEQKRKVVDLVYTKLNDTKEKIKCTYHSMCDKIKEASRKKDTLQGFVTDEKHVHSFFLVKDQVFKILSKWMPKKGWLYLKYGFSDPSLTGKVLAALSVIYPFLGGNMNVIPDFENTVLDVKMQMRGKIRLWHLFVALIRLLLTKDIRVTYKDFKEFNLD